MTTNFALPEEATEMTALYVRAMNSGDVEAVLSLYTEDAVSVWDPEKPISGEEHERAVREFMAQKPVMRAEVKESYVTGDTTLLVVDWSFDVPGSETLTGTGLDVLRRGEDGKWRYAIDNPFGDN
ncbi:YybH family protein [Saccharothrix obliqua]|uniref:YybH family protein n=1 Tax=Saccharothrix obliqua TaxID=2861747 RepID=UPI001C5FA43B|nr:nuclear transport factor 2 family protein [Saccharothrix obliqua]MBW4716728.1 nuclear transport factor 2 family protein [Saccharothrix obliqua]